MFNETKADEQQNQQPTKTWQVCFNTADEKGSKATTSIDKPTMVGVSKHSILDRQCLYQLVKRKKNRAPFSCTYRDGWHTFFFGKTNNRMLWLCHMALLKQCRVIRTSNFCDYVTLPCKLLEQANYTSSLLFMHFFRRKYTVKRDEKESFKS